MTEQNCGTCRHCAAGSSPHTNTSHLRCRRYALSPSQYTIPPSNHLDLKSYWPVVSIWDLCGEWSAREPGTCATCRHWRPGTTGRCSKQGWASVYASDSCDSWTPKQETPKQETP